MGKPEDENRLAEIREARERRLHALRLRAEREGYDTPPEVLNEIAELERKLQEVQIGQKIVNGGAVSGEVLRILRELAPNDVIIKTQVMQQITLNDLQKSMGELALIVGGSRALIRAIGIGLGLLLILVAALLYAVLSFMRGG